MAIETHATEGIGRREMLVVLSITDGSRLVSLGAFVRGTPIVGGARVGGPRG
jgi:hypothetical protein